MNTSSKTPTFSYLSYLVLAVIEGLPFTSINQGLKSLSISTSNPYKAKHLLSCTIIWDPALKVLIISF